MSSARSSTIFGRFDSAKAVAKAQEAKPAARMTFANAGRIC
jgi:hypothetical protein